MVEEDYYPLVEVVCAQMRRLSEAMVAAAAAGQSSAISAAATAGLAAGVDVPPSELLGLLRMLLRVNSPHWAETYDALATAVFVRLATPQLSAEGSSSTDLLNALSASEARRTVMALLHRNSLIPDHPLHRVLLRRLLHAPEALTDPAVAAAALLGLEVMVPGDEGVVSEDEGQQHTPVSAATTPESTVMTLAAPADSVLLVTSEDRACALRLLRRHGRSMSPTAFVAGLCVAPIHQMPLSTQTALVNHLTSVASAVPPVYLVKGMAAVVQSLHPSAVDDVSVRQWYSRFTARDVVRQVDAAGCAVLLDILSANPRFEQNCVVAKQAITRRIGVALLHAGDDEVGAGNTLSIGGSSGGGDGAESGRLPTAASAGGLTLEQLPLIVSALRRGRVFMPPYFSRVCRLLLSQVETAALGDLLSPFGATAEEFMRRQQREGRASVFKDVWELLRGRVLEQVATLALTDTCTALNAFAALDVCDRPLFGVLVHHLWRCVQEAGLTATQPGAAGSDGTVREVRIGSGKLDDAAGQGRSEEAEEAAVRRLAQVGEQITRALTPSALAVVVTTLCAREDALQLQQQRGHHQDSAAALHRRGDTMLPWMLLALRDRHTELYPIDVVHLLPTLLQRYTAAAAANGPLLPLLHAAYDACRTTFLHMYAVLPETAAVLSETTTTASAAAASPAPAPESGVEDSALTAEETRHIAAQRAAWSPAVQLSVRVVPRAWFAPILLRLSSAEVADVDVGLACVERVCTRRVCGMQLPVDQLVDVCLTMCWMFRVTDLGLDNSSSSTSTKDVAAMAAETAQASDEANVMATGGAKAVLRPAMAVILSALWYRCDELSAAHINAVLRCLGDTCGADRVDADFVQRLKAQKALIDARQKKAAATAAGETDAQSTAGAAAPTFPPPSAVEEMQADDLFSLM